MLSGHPDLVGHRLPALAQPAAALPAVAGFRVHPLAGPADFKDLVNLIVRPSWETRGDPAGDGGGVGGGLLDGCGLRRCGIHRFR